MGRPPYSTQTEIIAVASKSVATLEIIDTETVEVDQIKTVYLYAPEDSICSVTTMDVYLNAVPLSTRGTHGFYVYDNLAKTGYLNGYIDFDKVLYLAYGSVGGATMTPSDPVALIEMIKAVKFDDTNGIRFDYSNNTDAAQTLGRKFAFNVSIEKVK